MTSVTEAGFQIWINVILVIVNVVDGQITPVFFRRPTAEDTLVAITFTDHVLESFVEFRWIRFKRLATLPLWTTLARIISPITVAGTESPLAILDDTRRCLEFLSTTFTFPAKCSALPGWRVFPCKVLRFPFIITTFRAELTPTILFH
jgi:hypothetical protein